MHSMRSRSAYLCYALTFLLAVVSARPGGDGAEYLLVARALADHGTPEVTRADAEWVRQREPQWRRVAGRIAKGVEQRKLTPLPSVRRARGDRYYSLHFWFYSLLAVPFLWVTEFLRVRPILALACVNGLAASAALDFVFRRYGTARSGLVAAAAFMLCGTVLYLGWTGPEVLTAGAILVACMAARDKELGVGMAAGGLAASQNPSAVFVLPFVLGAFWPDRRRLRRYEIPLVLAGVGLAVLPYLFFFYEFRVWSLIGKFATSVELVSLERAFSLVFDLNQGMVMGLPGLLAGVPLVVVAALRAGHAEARGAIAMNAVMTLLLVAALAIPTFSIHNWNSGNVVFSRYGYWIAMPLLEVGLALGSRLASALRSAVVVIAASLQLGVLALNGPFGQRYSFQRHSPVAKVVLRYLPGAYNPVPEIFYERSLGWEAPRDASDVVVWPYSGTPGKIMVRAGRPAVTERICGPYAVVESDGIHQASDGWTYLDAPFRCRAQ
jgi:hypothetical protein